MSTIDIDTEVAAERASWLHRRSGVNAAVGSVVARELARLQLGDEGTVHAVQAASRHLRAAAVVLDTLVDRVIAADAFRSCTGSSSPQGDLAETFTCVERPSWLLGDARPWATLLGRALGDTADDTIVAHDEFEILQVDDDHFVLVLAGVIDLGQPNLGYDDRSRTVRDLDQGAIRSSLSPSLADNEYARYVSDAVTRYVPDGASIAIVGHSYGADTGFDLAADPVFNGQRYTVTHLAAFGYHTKHHLGAVPQRTEVLAVNNATDVVVLSESILDGPARVVDGHLGVARSLIGGNVVGLARSGGEIRSGIREMAADAAALRTAPATLLSGDPRVISDGNHHEVRFAGGFGTDAGHGQQRYIDFIENSELAVVAAFGESLVDRGYAPSSMPMTPIAVDVSKRD